jgi:hypothetical protein
MGGDGLWYAEADVELFDASADQPKRARRRVESITVRAGTLFDDWLRMIT